MKLLKKLWKSPQGGFSYVTGLLMAAATALAVIPLVYHGLSAMMAMLTVVGVSLLVIPVVYINSQR